MTQKQLIINLLTDNYPNSLTLKEITDYIIKKKRIPKKDQHYLPFGIFTTLNELVKSGQRIEIDPVNKGPRVGKMFKYKLPFQLRVHEWMINCFGYDITRDKTERNPRFIEEALELVQACGYTKEDCIKLVDYVFSRPKGEIYQEIGCVMVTLAALANNYQEIIEVCGETELKRIWNEILEIRLKNINKPKNSPLPQQ